MKTVLLIATMLLSLNAFAGGSIGLDQVLDELANGRKGDECVSELKGNPAMARALKKLNLEEVGSAIRIGHNNENCTGTRVPPYTFNSKDGKLAVEINYWGFLIQTVESAEETSAELLLNSVGSLYTGKIRREDAIKEVAHGHKQGECITEYKGNPFLASALSKLDLGKTGIGARITYNSVAGYINGVCSVGTHGQIVMPYGFKTTDGKLAVEINFGGVAVMPAEYLGQ
jgi:hypothetical protein